MNQKIKVRIPISQAIEEGFDIRIGDILYDKNKSHGRLIKNITIAEINIEEKFNRKLKQKIKKVKSLSITILYKESTYYPSEWDSTFIVSSRSFKSWYVEVDVYKFPQHLAPLNSFVENTNNSLLTIFNNISKLQHEQDNTTNRTTL